LDKYGLGLIISEAFKANLKPPSMAMKQGIIINLHDQHGELDPEIQQAKKSNQL